MRETKRISKVLPQHGLRIKSLHDAQAECACGGWSIVRTGSMTRTQIQREFLKHIYPLNSWEDRVQSLEAEGLTRSDAQAVVDAEDLRAKDCPRFESRLKPYSLDAICDSMLREGSRALRAHDLKEARFWQDGYLSIRPIVKSEIELATYLDRATRAEPISAT